MSHLRATKIKICGICDPMDAQSAVRLGAQYIGLIFVKDSPRYIEPAVARSIVAAIKDEAEVVGVFQDATLEEMENIAFSVGLDYFQLHGHESPILCSKLSRPVIKSFQIASESSANEPCLTLSFGDDKPGAEIKNCLSILDKYRLYCRHFLFDRPKKGFASNWLDFASRQLKLVEGNLGNYILAGGLDSNNIQTILQTLNPMIVDVASGVEETMRTKSKTLMAEFRLNVRALDTVSAQSGLEANN
jgi:phosphoribosylanthranilate isomerase